MDCNPGLFGQELDALPWEDKKKPGDVLLSHTENPCSTIGAKELNFRVRDGIGCGLFAMITGKLCWFEKY